MSEVVREPQQQRSRDKKNRIIEAGYELFARDGYFNTNTAEIAKYAGVSTGIVYGYFHDKRDILIDILDEYTDRVFLPILDMVESLKQPVDFSFVLPHIVDEAVRAHKENAQIHEALHSLTPTDKLVRDKFLSLEESITKRIAAKLATFDVGIDNLAERVHLAMETIQSYAHECVFDKHEYVDYTTMRTLVINMLMRLFDK